MKYIFLAIFIISTTIHLYASLKKNSKIRNISKPFILSSLLGFYVMAADTPDLFICLALMFSWIGDVLLIPKGVKWFTTGGISFLLSHVLFIAGCARDISFSKIPVLLILILAVFFVAIVSFTLSKLKPHLPSVLFYPVFLYLLTNGVMNCFTIFRCASNPMVATIITAIGAGLFFISDSSLFFVRFKKDSRLKTHFLVMFTYSIGELLIVLGFLL